MMPQMNKLIGKVQTVRGLVEPSALGAVMMHEHLHSDTYVWQTKEMRTEEAPTPPERRQYLIDNAVPLLKQCNDFGMHAYVDVTMPPWRAWPTTYAEVSELSGIHIILCTGFYREIELGKYWATTPDLTIWTFVQQSPVEVLTEMCIREIVEGIHGTPVHAGVIKLGTSQAPMTRNEIKAFRAGARAQLATGVHITTHCTVLGAETSQLTILDEEGVDLRRVVIGHTAAHLADKTFRKTCLEWMKRGANFLPTNMGIWDNGEQWRPLVNGIRDIFQAGHGDKLTLGLDSGYCTETGKFEPMDFLPPHPWTHMFTHTLPKFREFGLSAAEEKIMMETNPQRIVPVT
jgi:phosphotriesterase-related protein